MKLKFIKRTIVIAAVAHLAAAHAFDPMVDPNTGIPYPSGTTVYKTPEQQAAESLPPHIFTIDRPAAQSDFPNLPTTAGDCLVGRHWELVPRARCVCDGDLTHTPVSNDNPAACVGVPPPPPPVVAGNPPSFAVAPTPDQVLGGALACDQLGCLMADGSVVNANGQNVGSFTVDANGNIVSTIIGLGQVNFGANGGATYNAATGQYQTTNNIGGGICSDAACSATFGGTNNITVTTNQQGVVGVATASGGWLDVATGQVFDANGNLIGSGSVGDNGINVSLNDGSSGTINLNNPTNGQIISSVDGFSGSNAGTLNNATAVNGAPPQILAPDPAAIAAAQAQAQAAADAAAAQAAQAAADAAAAQGTWWGSGG